MAGFEILNSQGWWIDSVHGRWTMSHGVVYLEGQPMKSIAEAPVKKKPTKKKVSGLSKKKIKSAKI